MIRPIATAVNILVLRDYDDSPRMTFHAVSLKFVALKRESMRLRQTTLQIQFYHESRKAPTLMCRERLQKMKQTTAINVMPTDDDSTITGTLPDRPEDDVQIYRIVPRGEWPFSQNSQ